MKKLVILTILRIDNMKLCRIPQTKASKLDQIYKWELNTKFANFFNIFKIGKEQHVLHAPSQLQ